MLAQRLRLDREVLLPGASVLARAVTSVREASAARLWQALAARASTAGTAGLERMLEVEAGARVSTLERLRRAPTRLSSPAMVAALERLVEIRGLGVSGVDLSELPVGRVNELACYGMAAKAQTISRLSPERRAATLLAVAKHLETVANDDALDLFDGLAAQLIARSAKAGDRERLGQLPRLAEASAQLVLAMGVLLEADEDLTLQPLWAAIESHVPRSELEAAAQSVENLAHEVDPDDALRTQLVDRYLIARRFLPLLGKVVGFEATPGGRPALEALGSLSKLWGRKKVSPSEVVAAVVSASWRRLVFADPDQVDRRAYTLCVTEALHRGLRRRDVFCPASSRWADPTACLLDGERWEAMRPELLEGLALDPDPSSHLEALGAKLDQAYRAVADGVAGNALTTCGARPSLPPTPSSSTTRSASSWPRRGEGASGLGGRAPLCGSGTDHQRRPEPPLLRPGSRRDVVELPLRPGLRSVPPARLPVLASPGRPRRSAVLAPGARGGLRGAQRGVPQPGQPTFAEIHERIASTTQT